MAVKIGGGQAAGGSALPVVTGSEGSAMNADINMTPMIDVMLVLLIIFMIITPALGSYAAILPKTRTAAPEKDDRVTLGIDRDGRFFLDTDNRPIPANQLEQRLKQKYAAPERQDDHVLYLKADQGVAYSVVLTAIDAARQAGVRRIGAITEQAQAVAPPTGDIR